jgi:hypothetical protein
MLTARTGLEWAARKWIASKIAGSPFVRRHMAASMAGLSLAYASGPLALNDGFALGASWRGLAGQRAPDGSLPNSSIRFEQSLFDLYQRAAATLLLFSGMAPSDHGVAHLHEIAERIATEYGDSIRPLLIVATADRSGARTCLDPKGELHRRYGMRSEGACLVRPDGYVGYWSHSAQESGIRRYIERVFLPLGEA